MRPKITVLGDEDSAQRLRDADLAGVVTDLDDVSGSDVVVLYTGGDDVFERIRDCAPNAVVVVATGSPQPACEATLFPRARIVGLGDQGADVVEVVESIVLDRGRVFTAVARCEGERGIESEFAAVPVKLGARGIEEIVES